MVISGMRAIPTRQQAVSVCSPLPTAHCGKGQSLVEFALSLPILLLIVFGMIEFGRLLFIYTAVTSSSREAARYGAVVGVTASGAIRYNDCAGIRAAARRIGSLAGIQDSDITIQYDHGPGTGVYASCPPGRAGLSDRIVVQTRLTFRPIVPLVGLSAFDITSVTVRTFVKDVPTEP